MHDLPQAKALDAGANSLDIAHAHDRHRISSNVLPRDPSHILRGDRHDAAGVVIVSGEGQTECEEGPDLRGHLSGGFEGAGHPER